MSQLIAVVMAAGHGTRMKSEIPKVLHTACGRRLLEYPVLAALEAGANTIVVVANEENQEQLTDVLRSCFPEVPLVIAVQPIPRGTGDAARVGLRATSLQPEDRVLLLNGDVPLIEGPRLREMVASLDRGDRLCFLSFLAENPAGYGRVIRDGEGRVLEIREERDLRSEKERVICEVNGGIYAGRAGDLTGALAALTPNNTQGEYYVTDIVNSIRNSGSVSALRAERDELRGVNDRAQLAEVEAILHQRVRRRLGVSGVNIVGCPLIDETCQVEPDARIEDGVRMRGFSRVGARTVVDVGCVLVDAAVGQDVHIKPYCVVVSSTVGDAVQLGPFAHLRPGSVLEPEVHIGNFVETKQTLVKRGAKANHLAYLGDAEIGEKANVGAGTIICNYDGFQKQRTVIERDAFIGSDSQIIAPVTIGEGAYVATGTTVTDDVPAGALCVGRTRQTNKEGYAARLRARLLAQKLGEG